MRHDECGGIGRWWAGIKEENTRLLDNGNAIHARQQNGTTEKINDAGIAHLRWGRGYRVIAHHGTKQWEVWRNRTHGLQLTKLDDQRQGDCLTLLDESFRIHRRCHVWQTVSVRDIADKLLDCLKFFVDTILHQHGHHILQRGKALR